MLKKKLLSMLLAVTMVFAMAPLSMGVAFADEENDGEATVGATEEVTDEVTEEMPEVGVPEDVLAAKEQFKTIVSDDVPIDGYNLYVGEEQVGPENTSGDGWTYSGNATKGTLTLTNANITGISDISGPPSTIFSYGIDLTLKLVGTNYVGDGYNIYGIFAANYFETSDNIGAGKLTIEGDGTLNVESEYLGIYTYCPVAINGAAVDLKTLDGYCPAVVSEAYDNNAGITITNSKVTTNGGIYAEYCDLTIKDSEVTAEGSVGLMGKKITIGNSGSGKYVTRVEATAGMGMIGPEPKASLEKRTFPAIIGTDAITLNDDLKIVEPAGGVIKEGNVGIMFSSDGQGEAYSVFKGDEVAPHVIIQGQKKENKKENNQSAAAPVFIAKISAKGKNKMKISWDGVSGAEGYDIFLSKCNKGKKKYKVKLVKTVTGKNSWTKKKLKAKRAYKIMVKAWVMKDGQKTYIAESPLAHAYTSGGKGKYTNPKSVSVAEPAVTLNTGGTSVIKAKIKKVKKGKKLISMGHANLLRYVSTDPSIAEVDGSGMITAKSAGTCTVYVFTANGAKAAVTVTVN